MEPNTLPVSLPFEDMLQAYIRRLRIFAETVALSGGVCYVFLRFYQYRVAPDNPTSISSGIVEYLSAALALAVSQTLIEHFVAPNDRWRGPIYATLLIVSTFPLYSTLLVLLTKQALFLMVRCFLPVNLESETILSAKRSLANAKRAAQAQAKDEPDSDLIRNSRSIE